MVQRAKGQAVQAAPTTNGQAQESPDDGLNLPDEINKEIFNRSCAAITERGEQVQESLLQGAELADPRSGGGRAKGALHQSVLVAYDPDGTDLIIRSLRSRGLGGEFWDRRAQTTSAGTLSTYRSHNSPDRACSRGALAN